VGSVDTTPAPDPGDGEPERGQEQGQDPDVTGHVPHDPLRFDRWMKRSAAGAVLSGIALGLKEALEPKRNQPAFVMEAPGEPEDPDAPISLRFDPDDPTRTVAVIRDRGVTGASAQASDADGADSVDDPADGPDDGHRGGR